MEQFLYGDNDWSDDGWSDDCLSCLCNFPHTWEEHFQQIERAHMSPPSAHEHNVSTVETEDDCDMSWLSEEEEDA